MSCTGWKSRGATEDGDYMIDPDGAGGEAPFSVNCTFTSSSEIWTSISPNQGLFTVSFVSTSHEDPYSSVFDLTYPVTDTQLQGLAAMSVTCKMYVNVDCYNMVLKDYAGWFGVGGNQQPLEESLCPGRSRPCQFFLFH